VSSIENIPQIHKPNIRQQHDADKYKNIPKPYMQVAEGMEEQFTNHLLGEMRKTVHSTAPDSQATKVYKSMLENERAKLMAQSSSGLGIKDLVLDQIYPKHRRVSAQNTVKMYKQNNSQGEGRHE
jgi:Rod binding domain-containing protein